MPTLAATRPPTTGAAPRHGADLLADLAEVDEHGWDSPVGETLLRRIRHELVHPLVLGTGLRGRDAAEAEATGWTAAWSALSQPALRTAESPWGFVWRAVHRAVLGEVLAARYQVSPRTAWRLRERAGGGATGPVCFELRDILPELPADPPADPAAAPREILAGAVQAFEGVGWPASTAQTLVLRIVEDSAPGQKDQEGKSGWRLLAADLDLPPWQVRRVSVVLLGAPGWAGILERLLDGRDVRTDLSVRAALASTRVRSHRSPALAAHRAATESADPAPLRVAS